MVRMKRSFRSAVAARFEPGRSPIQANALTHSATVPPTGVIEVLRRAAKLRLLNFLSLFRDLQKPTRFSGGGVVAEFVRDLQLRNQIFTQH